MPQQRSVKPSLPTEMPEMTKQEARTALRERRAALSDEQRRDADQAIVAHIADSRLLQTASMLLLYVPMKDEINLLPLVRICRQRGIPVAFPKCDTETGRMAFYRLEEGAKLSPGAYDIPEPPLDAPLCVPDEDALCLLPGLSFDAFGNRLGYGKGYYDRYLAAFPGVTAGTVYADMMLEAVPTDAHDISAHFVINETGIHPAREHFAEAPTATPHPTEEEEPHAQTDAPKDANADSKAGTPKKSTAAWLAKLQKAVREDRKGEHIKPLHLPPLLVLCTFALLLLSRLIDARLLDRDSEYVGVVLLQILIFILPAILYCKLRGNKLSGRIRMAPIRPTHLFLVLWIFCMMLSLSLLSSILTGGIASLEGNFTLYGTFVAHTGSPWDIFYSILAYALLPAFGEELVFRSVLSAEYEDRGVAVSVTVSALFFAMLHFSLPHFLTYFLMGILLSLSMYATRSFFTPVLLHLGYNLFCLFGQPYLSAFYVHAGSHEIFVFCLVVICLLSSAFAAGEARKIYHLYAIKNADSSYTAAVPWHRGPRNLFFSLLSPTVAACIAVWLTAAILNLN